MKVLYVSYRESLLGGASRGVIETQVVGLLSRLRRATEVTWVAYVQDEATDDSPVPEWNHVSRLPRAGAVRLRVQVIRDLRKRIKSWDPQIVHARGYNATLVALLASSGRVPVVFDPRGLMPIERIGYRGVSPRSISVWGWRALERLLVSRSNATVAVSPPMKEYFIKLAKRARVEVIPLAVAVDRFAVGVQTRAHSRRQLGLSEDSVGVLYSGSLAPAGLDHLRKTLSRIARGTPKARFVVASRDPEAESFCRDVLQDGLFVRHVSVSPAAMPDVLAACDWGLALREPQQHRILNEIELTTKVPEYLASGLPVLVFQTSTYLATLITNHALGQCVNPASPDPIVLYHWSDKDRARLRSTADGEFSEARVAEDYLRLYASI